MSKIDIDYRKVVGFIPIYIDGYGNGTRVILEEGERLYYKSAKSFLNKMCKYYFLDINEAKRYYGNILGIKNLIPIPFDKKIFIPIKFRVPIYKHDGAMGYLYLDFIEKIEAIEDGTRISLIDERSFKSIAREDTVRKHYKNGYIVKRFSNIDLYDELYNYPATKRDIEMLIREVNSIKDRIK